jgi:hypothetical protein
MKKIINLVFVICAVLAIAGLMVNGQAGGVPAITSSFPTTYRSFFHW